MKKEFRLITILAIMLSLSFITAAGVEVELNKQEFYQGEVLRAEIEGVFLENLQLENINIYQDPKVHASPLSGSNLLKLENTYVYYAVLPYTVGDYSLKIEDMKYHYGQEIREGPIEINFTISSTLEPYVSVNKGFITATNDFEIKLKSLNGIQEISVSFAGQEFTKEIGYNQEKTFKFNIDDFDEYTETTLDAGGLEVPVYVYPRQTPPEPFINGTENQSIPTGDDPTPSEPETTPLEDATPQQIQTCADLDAILCKKNEKCQGPTTFARDVVCCAGTCMEKKTSYTWVWGVVIIIILGAAGFWFYKRSKKEQSKSTERSKKPLKNRTDAFQKRMNPKPEMPKGPEVRKGLGRE
jgi:hypothetical protein